MQKLGQLLTSFYELNKDFREQSLHSIDMQRKRLGIHYLKRKQNQTKPNKTKPKPNQTKPNKTKPNETKPNETKLNETKPN